MSDFYVYDHQSDWGECEHRCYEHRGELDDLLKEWHAEYPDGVPDDRPEWVDEPTIEECDEAHGCDVVGCRDFPTPGACGFSLAMAGPFDDETRKLLSEWLKGNGYALRKLASK